MDLETIKKIAEMARISVPEAELSKVANDVSNMVSFVEAIKNVDVPKNADNQNFEFNVLRADKVSPIDSAYDLIEAAPVHQDHFVKVPKIIE